MPATAEKRAPKPLPPHDGLRSEMRTKIASGILPLIGVGGVISATATFHPGIVMGSVLLATEIALGLVSLFILWPRQNANHR